MDRREADRPGTSSADGVLPVMEARAEREDFLPVDNEVGYTPNGS